MPLGAIGVLRAVSREGEGTTMGREEGGPGFSFLRPGGPPTHPGRYGGPTLEGGGAEKKAKIAKTPPPCVVNDPDLTPPLPFDFRRLDASGRASYAPLGECA